MKLSSRYLADPDWVAVVLMIVAVILDAHSSFVKGESGGDFFKTRTFINPGRPGPWIYASRGEVWPKPQVMRNAGKNFSIIQPGEGGPVFKVSTKIIKSASSCIYFETQELKLLIFLRDMRLNHSIPINIHSHCCKLRQVQV